METAVQLAPLVRFVRGDLDAFEALFRDSQAEVYRWIARIVRDPSAAEELTIEAFWRAYQARARFDPNRSLAPWLRRIAVNLAIGHLKRMRPQTIPLPENASAAAPMGLDPGAREQISAAFHSLPIKLRVPAQLALIEELPQREIAEALGISEAAVKARVFRATQLLRQKLTRMGIQP